MFNQIPSPCNGCRYFDKNLILPCTVNPCYPPLANWATRERMDQETIRLTNLMTILNILQAQKTSDNSLLLDNNQLNLLNRFTELLDAYQIQLTLDKKIELIQSNINSTHDTLNQLVLTLEMSKDESQECTQYSPS